MSRSNTAQSYGSIAKTFHWLTALLVIIVNHLGVITNDMGYETSEQLARKFIFFQCIKPWVSRFSLSPLLVSFGPSANPNPTDCIRNAKPRLGSPKPSIGRPIAHSSWPPTPVGFAMPQQSYLRVKVGVLRRARPPQATGALVSPNAPISPKLNSRAYLPKKCVRKVLIAIRTLGSSVI